MASKIRGIYAEVVSLNTRIGLSPKLRTIIGPNDEWKIAEVVLRCFGSLTSLILFRVGARIVET